MISWQGRLENLRTGFRMHSQGVAFWLGLLLAGATAWLWQRKILGDIPGSFLVGVGAAILAAAVVAYLSPFNEPAFRRFLSFKIEYVWLSRQTIDSKYWVDRLNGAQEQCILLGIAHGGWCGDAMFLPTVHERLQHNVVFKMLFLNPNLKAAELRSAEEMRQSEKSKRETRDVIRESIKTMWDFRRGLEAGLRDRLRLYAYEATPSCGLMWIDKKILVTHYLAGLPDVTSPALLVASPEGEMEGSLYNIYAKNLEEIEGHSIVIVEENIDQFLPKGA
jgi:hypothetical protein